MLQQSFGAIRAPHRHRIVVRHLPHRPVLGLEGPRRIGGGPERPRLVQPPLTAPRELVVVLELPGIVLVHPKGGRRHRLHVLRGHRHRLVRPGVVGLRRLVHVLAPAAPPPGNHAREVLLERLNRPVHHRRGIAVRGVLLPVHRPSGQGSLQPPELVAQIRGDDVVALALDERGDDLRGRRRHRFRPLVGQRLGGNLPGEDVLHHQPVLVPPPRVLAEVHQVRLQPVVGPLRRTLPQAPGLGRQDLPGHVAAQGRRGPRTRQVPPVRELPPGDLKELAGIPHVEVPGQLLEQPDGLLFRHF